MQETGFGQGRMERRRGVIRSRHANPVSTAVDSEEQVEG